MSQLDRPGRSPTGPAYPWVVVGLLWFCGFFNYADRQALSAVFPLLSGEFGIGNPELGLLSSAFMLLYALTSPLTGYVVDRLSRRLLIAAGLAFWSLICAATGTAQGFGQLLLYRAAEGLGESFYFPASMSVLADYHGPRTRSRAMSLHQTSVYLGNAGGWYLGGQLGEVAGWRAPFWGLGLAGLLYALLLAVVLVEPKRSRSSAGGEDASGAGPTLPTRLGRIVASPAAAMLLVVFIGANFVATAFLTWLPSLVGRGFRLGLTNSALTSAFWPLASIPGAALGGWLADRLARRSLGGRIRVQCLGLLLAAPFVLLVGRTESVGLLMVGLVAPAFARGSTTPISSPPCTTSSPPTTAGPPPA